MLKPQIKEISEYLKDLEEGLYEWDYDRIAMQTEWPKLYQTIKLLMDETYKTKDQKLKPILAIIELRARRCKECIEMRLGVRNWKELLWKKNY